MELSINELADLTGKDRRTITQRLEQLDYEDGPKGAHLYDSRRALALIYGPVSSGKSLDQAKTEQALESAQLARVRREELQKTRLPVEILAGLWDSAMQAAAATLKGTIGKVLTPAKANEILDKLREGEIPSRW